MNDTTSNPEPVDSQTNEPSQADSASAQPDYSQAGSEQTFPGPGTQFPYSQGGYAQQGYNNQPQTGTPPMQGFFDWIRRLNLVRTSDRWFGGVAGGLARKMGVGTGLIRLLLFLLIVFGGVSLWFYLIAWFVLPDERTGTIPMQRLVS